MTDEQSNTQPGPEGIPFTITRKMKKDLAARGFTPEQIQNMTPGQARLSLEGTPGRPTALPPRFENFPAKLTAQPNWVLWRYEPPEKPNGKWRKVPYQPNGYKANTTERGTWSSFETCRAVYEPGGYDGIGFCFDDEAIDSDGYCLVGIDLDGCIGDKSVQPLARKWIARLDTYTELSPSGTGFHLIARAKPLDRQVKYGGVEIYCRGRYFTFTGCSLKQKQQIKATPAEVHALIAEVWAKQAAEGQSKPTTVLFNGAKVAQAFAHLDPNKSLGEGIKAHWFDLLKPEHKDEVVAHALAVIVAFMEESGGHTNPEWYRLTTAVARSGAPNAEAIFVKRASATKNPEPEAVLRELFARLQKDPPPNCQGITVGTLLGLAREHGADFERWRGLEQEPQRAEAPVGLNFINAGLDDWKNVGPRGWLLGNIFCREFVSSLLGDGGVGKTALRYAQYISLATGKPLTGEHVFIRSRVLLISLEDGLDELRRRIMAACFHHSIEQHELDGWLYYVAVGAKDGKLMVLDGRGRPVPGSLAGNLEHDIVKLRADLVALDPFVKTHGIEENNNSAVDDVVQILTDMATGHAIAVDVPHHMAKGPADPGNANRGRGASAMKDAARLVYTLTAMTTDEAGNLGVAEAERRFLVRMDGGKTNIAPPATDATWFRLVGVPLGNGSEIYPNGDIVQTVERWTPPDIMRDLPVLTIHKILDAIEAGLPNGELYSDSAAAKKRAAWRLIVQHCPEKTEGPAKQIIAKWLKIGLLVRVDYVDKTRHDAKGLAVDNSRRPT